MVRENGGIVFLPPPDGWVLRRLHWNCVFWCLRSPRQGYHGITGVAIDDIAGGRDEIWEQTITKLKKRSTLGRWEVGEGKFCSREVTQAADGSMRVGQPPHIKSLDFVPL